MSFAGSVRLAYFLLRNDLNKRPFSNTSLREVQKTRGKKTWKIQQANVENYPARRR